MRLRTALSLASLFLLGSTVAVWSVPLNAEPSDQANTVPEAKRVSGKIASVGDAEFALEVRQDQKTHTMQFLVDGDTKVEGRLLIGGQATVEFRSEGGRNIATHVSMVPASGMQAR